MEFRRDSLELFHINGKSPKYVPPELRKVLRRKLIMIDRSATVSDLRVPPANHLEKLRGQFEGFYSIRVNAQWRIIFRWTEKGAIDVDFIDYH
ncbi:MULTISPECIES: type II toxin-antitoxin system RelE/ParE family toxin [Corynebacterium]|uniref:Type II toxin-antitoxin system RelE/ParE family toxin n=1 Tax=Corynebacterium accolens TaxID=38284 RepID=A0AAP4C0J8_9CORY|nr:MULTISPECIES: type II toxin-antitoxin system RelE/ParE family toxin [Corynebacterium]MDK4335937.1 type II toxin-antitoxin system RelE/ParE family toxin [Corynebacterium accolens]MDK8451626.1 type II toxin-antitoxin system RelE/ParE family toxin [Corynebacterium sp. MSK084]MDK8466135.1 type II toxin-antitoxin system RelE/ParE family toxin [Corynebacterium sp. MSK130]MDK8475751.1 type II toxin-antitoxin system RelE/ParE family toxin [Corynebacterium sp. MSK310]MDK8490561.1 type II toxin-antit